MDELVLIQNQIAECRSCSLHETRTNTVPGEGDFRASLMFVGEGPGADEDREGRPFVGRSGKLLDKALEAAGLFRSQVFISNVVHCRPPENRNPDPTEITACVGFLVRQIAAINPTLVVTLGRIPAEVLTGKPVKITKENGHLHFPSAINGRAVMTIYHPSFVLRNHGEIEKEFFEAVASAKKLVYG